MQFPSTIEPDFLSDCPYGPGGFLIDQILLIDRESHLVRARMPTHDDLPLTREQKVHPVLHPRHVSGGLMIHMTGMVAFIHTYYVLGLRHRDGWIGYGARIHDARFKALAAPNEPLILECQMTQHRHSGKRVLARYDFRFMQKDTLIYEGDQTAMWLHVGADAKPQQ